MNSHNFLDRFSEHEISSKQTVLLLIFVPIITILSLFVWHIYPLAIFVTIAITIIVILLIYPNLGLYLLVFFGLFHGWIIDFSLYQRFRHIPYISGINAPVVDFIAIFLFISVCIALILRMQRLPTFSSIRKLIPGIFIYIFLIIISIFSSFSAYNHLIGQSLKYVLRPIIFVFLMYWILPIHIINKKNIEKVLYILLFVGTLIALFGLSSLFVLPQTGWHRVVPYGVKGFAPLGYNHNQIAEILVGLIPISFLFLMRSNRRIKLIYGLILSVILSSALLTLSRAAWISVFAELVFFGWIFRIDVKKYIKEHTNVSTIIITILLPILLYMGVFLGSSVVKSSNSARVVATKMALFYAVRQPFVGYGPGMFESVIGDTYIYVLDFGETLDAHGFIQKIMLEEGFLGLILFIIFLLWNLYYLYQHRNNENVVFLLGSVIGVVVFQLFNTSYFNSVMWIPFGIATATAYSQSKNISV